MDLMTVILIALLIVLVSALLMPQHWNKKRPPGPIGLPIVGYIPFLTKKPYVKMHELRKKYGPVYSLKLGSKNTVVLADFKIIKEVFAQEVMMGRPKDSLPFDLSKETLESGAFTGMAWTDQRRFSLHVLRDLGFGKSQMEQHIKEEIEELLERLKHHVGKPTVFTFVITPSISNNIASVLFGKRLTWDDPQRKHLDRMLSEISLLAGQMSWHVFFPWIKVFLKVFHLGNQDRLSTTIRNLKEYIRKQIEEHESTLDPNNVRDLIDAYLLEIKKDKDPTFNKAVLMDLCWAYFAAGSETVRSSVDWVLLIAASFPEVQKRVQNEIDIVLGHERFPTRKDHHKMPYTEAVILESSRWRPVIPINIVRSPLKDTKINGHFIPKDTIVIANLWSTLNDENLWGKDVKNFRPERFLSEDGKEVRKPEYHIPFSIGKRACPGKNLAEVEVFLYFTTILQKFKLSLPLGKVGDLEGVLGIGLQPKKQEIIIKFR